MVPIIKYFLLRFCVTCALLQMRERERVAERYNEIHVHFGHFFCAINVKLLKNITLGISLGGHVASKGGSKITTMKQFVAQRAMNFV